VICSIYTYIIVVNWLSSLFTIENHECKLRVVNQSLHYLKLKIPITCTCISLQFR